MGLKLGWPPCEEGEEDGEWKVDGLDRYGVGEGGVGWKEGGLGGGGRVGGGYW